MRTRYRFRPRWAGVGIALWLAAISDVRADEVGNTSLLRQGIALRKEHRNEEAIAVFARAVAIAPTPVALAQLALAEQAVGRWLDAERDLDTALATPDDPWIDKHRAELEADQDVVREHLAWLTVEIEVPDAEIVLDGKALSPNQEQRVLAGALVLEVRAPGHGPYVQSVTVAAGERKTLPVVLTRLRRPDAEETAGTSKAPTALSLGVARVAPVEAPVTQPVLRRSSAVASPPTIALALGAAGLASLGVTTYFGIRTIDYKNARDEACRPGGCSPSALAAYQGAQTSAAVSTISFGIGVGLVVSAGISWLMARSPSAQPMAAIQVIPIAQPGFTGLAVRGM